MNSKKGRLIFSGICLLFLVVTFSIAFLIQGYNEKEYQQANDFYNNEEYAQAEEIYLKLGNYKDSEELRNCMNNLAKQLEDYISANNFLAKGMYAQAIETYEKIATFKDSDTKLKEAKYGLGISYYENNNYEEAKKIFIELGDYSESELYLAQIEIKLMEQYQEIVYQKALSYYEDKKYKEALELFETLNDYKDSNKFSDECVIELKRRLHNNIIAAGIRNSAAITSTKHVKVIGNKGFGQCDVDEWQDIISVDIYGTLTIGLKENNVAVVTGQYDRQELFNLDDWDNIIDVAAGEQFVVGLKENGDVIATGHPSDGQLMVEGWEDVIAIDAGARFSVGLTKEKKLLFAGFDNGQENEFKNHEDEWKDVVNIAASGGVKNQRGGGHTVGLKSDGTLVAVGDNEYGQCDFSDTEKWSDIVKVATGDWYTVGLKSNGTVVITGENSSGNYYINKEVLESCTNIVDIAAGYGHTLCLTEDGKIIAFGFNDENKCNDAMNSDWTNLMLPEY